MKNIEPKAELYDKIEILREQMHRAVAAESINSQETYRISQKLDQLIMQVMRNKQS